MRILRNLVANWDGNTTVQLQSPFGNPRHDMGGLTMVLAVLGKQLFSLGRLGS